MNLRDQASRAGVFFLCLVSYFQSAFTGLLPNPAMLLPIAAAAILTPFAERGLKRSLTLLFLAHTFAMAAASLLVLNPIRQLLGPTSAELASIVVVRNVLLYGMLLALPLSIAALAAAGYISERKPRRGKIAAAFCLAAIPLSSALLLYSYSDWYNEVYAVKTLSVELESARYATSGEYPTLELKLSLRTSSPKAVYVDCTRYYVYSGDKLVRQAADSYPEGMQVSEAGREISKSLSLPSDLPPTCFTQGSCTVKLQLVVRTRFGLSLIDFPLNLSSKAPHVPAWLLGRLEESL